MYFSLCYLLAYLGWWGLSFQLKINCWPVFSRKVNDELFQKFMYVSYVCVIILKQYIWQEYPYCFRLKCFLFHNDSPADVSYFYLNPVHKAIQIFDLALYYGVATSCLTVIMFMKLMSDDVDDDNVNSFGKLRFYWFHNWFSTYLQEADIIYNGSRTNS